MNAAVRRHNADGCAAAVEVAAEIDTALPIFFIAFDFQRGNVAVKAAVDRSGFKSRRVIFRHLQIYDAVCRFDIKPAAFPTASR